MKPFSGSNIENSGPLWEHIYLLNIKSNTSLCFWGLDLEAAFVNFF